MKKIGIVTLYKNNKNYGGLLQAYSTQYITSKLGYDSEVLNYETNLKNYKKNRIKNLGLRKSFIILTKKINTKIHLLNKKTKHKIDLRNKKFSMFENEIKHSNLLNDQNIDTYINKYNYLICGSDQVWNPGLWNNVLLLNINSYKGKKISYAASLGRAYLSNEEKNILKKQLNTYDAISVREKSFEIMLKKIIDKNVQTVLDPTFLLTKNDWNFFSKPVDSLLGKKFVFCYFLHKNTLAKKSIKNFCLKNNLIIVNIPHLQNTFYKYDEKFGDIKLYDIDPHNWVWLIQNSEFVFTDSFHGTAFSINNNKQFISFANGKNSDKKNINSRLYDLLNLFSLENRLVTDFKSINKYFNEPINYETINQKVIDLRQKSLCFLETSLKNEE